jgi:four helix bundle protein
LNSKVALLLQNKSFDRVTIDQFRGASFSVMLNIAEGAGRDTKPAQRNFYVIARGSVFECAAIIDFLKDQNQIGSSEFDVLYQELEELSKMLLGLIRWLKK